MPAALASRARRNTDTVSQRAHWTSSDGGVRALRGAVVSVRVDALSQTYYHGGIAGLDVGDVLSPSDPHVSDGCPICVARQRGVVCTVGAYRLWIVRQMHGLPAHKAVTAQRLLDSLSGVPFDEPMDPPSKLRAVYLTTSLDYATFYAARSGHGDVYRVRPDGPTQRSVEDHFPTVTCERAVIVSVIRRGVELVRSERRKMERLWKKADKVAEERTLLTRATPGRG